ncbi:MAG: hypothetical protein PVI90_14845, partial [Desulfobacteraceae bacterium]
MKADELNHLKPCFSTFVGMDFMFEYHTLLREFLIKSDKKRAILPIVQMVVTPSFTLEYIVSVFVNGSGERFIEYAISNANIWGARYSEINKDDASYDKPP